jgi:hypothetical protein
MDASTIFTDLRAALKGELGEGYSTISSFIERQGRLLADQAAFIAEQRATGSLRDNDALFEHFLEGLKTNAVNLTHHVAMLTALTIEKTWNAVANVLWGAIRTIMSASGVPAALLPATPPHI